MFAAFYYIKKDNNGQQRSNGLFSEGENGAPLIDDAKISIECERWMEIMNLKALTILYAKFL